MNRVIRRILGIRSPAEEHGAAAKYFAQQAAEGWNEGLRNPGPPDPEKLAVALAYTEGVARRSFSTLYEDHEDDPPVQCWHYEPGSPCDWDVCRQPERLAAGDVGTDPAEGAR